MQIAGVLEAFEKDSTGDILFFHLFNDRISTKTKKEIYI